MISPFKATLAPSRICLGTGGFGSEIPVQESWAVLDAYIAAGGNFLDTAHIYAAWVEGGWGKSERTIGEWLRANGMRKQVVLGTKGGHPPLDDMARGRCSRTCIESDLNESLDRLGVDSVDLYWLHRDDPERPVGEIMETLALLVRDGRVACCGASNWTLARIKAANAYAAEHGLPGFVASQPGWALADHVTDASAPSPMRYMDDATHRWHLETGFPVLAYSAQACGFFGEANVAWARGGFAGPIPKRPAYDSPQNRRRLLNAIAMADARGVSANQIALAYLLNQPFPVFPIIGTSKPERVHEAFAATTIVLSEEELRTLCGA